MTSWASVMEHMTFGLALCKSKKIARKNCARNAPIPALGYGAVQEKVKSQVQNCNFLLILQGIISTFPSAPKKETSWLLASY